MDDTDISEERLGELLNEMPNELRNLFLKMMMKTSSKGPLKIIKQFLDEYEDDSPIDSLIANVVMMVITKMGYGLTQDIKKAKKLGVKTYSGEDLARRSIVEMKGVLSHMEESILKVIGNKKEKEAMH